MASNIRTLLGAESTFTERADCFGRFLDKFLPALWAIPPGWTICSRSGGTPVRPGGQHYKMPLNAEIAARIAGDVSPPGLAAETAGTVPSRQTFLSIREHKNAG